MFKDEMTALERKTAYFKGEEVDRLPCCLAFEESAAVYAGLTTREYYFEPEKMLESYRYVVNEFGVESICANVTLRGIAEALGSQISYSDLDPAYLKEPILKDYSMLEHMEVADPYKDGRLPIVIKAVGLLKKEIGHLTSIGSGVSDPFSAAALVRGTDVMMRDIKKNPDKVFKLLDIVTQSNLAFVKALYEETGVTCSIGGPISSGNLISTKTFEEFSLPYLKKQVEGIYKITSEHPSIHICGKTNHLWPHMRDLNISAFSLDNCEDLEAAKKALGDVMCVVGNVDPSSILRFGKPEDVDFAVKECIEKAADTPCGYIVATGCDIPRDCPPENIHAMVNAVRKYSKGIRIGQKSSFFN